MPDNSLRQTIHVLMQSVASNQKVLDRIMAAVDEAMKDTITKVVHDAKVEMLDWAVDHWLDPQSTEAKYTELKAEMRKNKADTLGASEGRSAENEPVNKQVDTLGELSDGYHTFNELYEFRLLYNAAFFNSMKDDPNWGFGEHKSWHHADAPTESIFDKDWFIVMATLPTGQISNHYPPEDWELFQIPEREVADKWDGHTTTDVAIRLRQFITGNDMTTTSPEDKKKVTSESPKSDPIMQILKENFPGDNSVKLYGTAHQQLQTYIAEVIGADEYTKEIQPSVEYGVTKHVTTKQTNVLSLLRNELRAEQKRRAGLHPDHRYDMEL